MSILTRFVEFFMFAKLQEEIEDEIEYDRMIVPDSQRSTCIQQISDSWKMQGEMLKDVDVRPNRTKF